jgi:putative ABC transport system substrate-binding protein
VDAKDPSEFEPAFATLAHQGVGGLVPGSDTLFFNRPVELVELADRYRIPTIYYRNEAMAAGGLMSYGTDLPETWRQAGRYAGRILKGEKPANLPVQQAVKMRLALNPKAARGLGLRFPATLLARADEVIE